MNWWLLTKENYISWKELAQQKEEYEACEDFEKGEECETCEDFGEDEEYETCEGFEEDGEEVYEDFGEDGDCEDFEEDGEEVYEGFAGGWEYEISEDFEEDEEYEETPRYRRSRKEILEGKYCNVMALLAHMLTEVQKTSTLFRRFFGISIEALFEYWKNLLETENEVMILLCEEMDFDSTAGRLGICIGSETTIGDIFKKAHDVRTTAWRPSEPIEEYRDRILDAFALYEEPLFGIFKTVFPERSDPQQIVGMQIG